MRDSVKPDSEPSDIGVEEAYAVEGPDENRRLYAAWADTYDATFVEAKQYVYPSRVAEIFASGMKQPPGAVLDVGCGTGVVGAELRRLGVTEVDGLDISAQMLQQAATKTDVDGPVYRDLIEGDLTGTVPVAGDAYAGIVSAGTFTHGHLGPESFAELYRMAAPGARCAIGINSAHFDALGFEERLRLDFRCGVISEYGLVDVAIYGDTAITGPDTTAVVAVFEVN